MDLEKMYTGICIYEYLYNQIVLQTLHDQGYSHSKQRLKIVSLDRYYTDSYDLIPIGYTCIHDIRGQVVEWGGVLVSDYVAWRSCTIELPRLYVIFNFYIYFSYTLAPKVPQLGRMAKDMMSLRDCWKRRNFPVMAIICILINFVPLFFYFQI